MHINTHRTHRLRQLWLQGLDGVMKGQGPRPSWPSHLLKSRSSRSVTYSTHTFCWRSWLMYEWINYNWKSLLVQLSLLQITIWFCDRGPRRFNRLTFCQFGFYNGFLHFTFNVFLFDLSTLKEIFAVCCLRCVWIRITRVLCWPDRLL